MDRYNFICTVKGSSLADLNWWLSNHTAGRHLTRQNYVQVRVPGFRELQRKESDVSVYLDLEEDRLALRAAYDVIETIFTR